MLDYEEFFASVGEPLGSAEPRGEGCWERKFTRALVVLNPQPAGGEAGSCAVTLQPEVPRETNRDNGDFPLRKRTKLAPQIGELNHTPRESKEDDKHRQSSIESECYLSHQQPHPIP